MAGNTIPELELEKSLDRVSEGIDRILAERALLLGALRNICESTQTDSDTCVICGEDLARHASGCAVAVGLAAIEEATRR